MAEKIRRTEALKAKRKREEVMRLDEEAERKRVRREEDDTFREKVKDLTAKAVDVLQSQMEDGTEQVLKRIYGKNWEAGKELEKERLGKEQNEWRKRMSMAEDEVRKIREREMIPLKKGGVFLDDFDPRF